LNTKLISIFNSIITFLLLIWAIYIFSLASGLLSRIVSALGGAVIVAYMPSNPKFTLINLAIKIIIITLIITIGYIKQKKNISYWLKAVAIAIIIWNTTLVS